ncbi:hypothetical protein Pyrfu_0886 [Pyrolobus fumarii 1A]|uniref:Uncharacterized protein n=1 Tax=Pyrolobus fumarii (strain DSM 11204 / 1A) TaxID=694429 RepID=G0EE61_PYRF1|nr:hypothetical protein [Pyrolobus fumarii]AEM38755.1 hypothetical protein Pyrfu_0886 [Pyrolobus fumarii 1A]
MPRKKPVFYVKWGPGKALEMEVSEDVMILRGDGFELDLEPRSVRLEASEFAVREYSDDKRKRVYIDVPVGIHGVQAPRVDIDGTRMVGYFEVRLTEIENLDRYLTIITPGGFLYDYVVVTSEGVMFETSAKRKLYREEVPGEAVTIYLV